MKHSLRIVLLLAASLPAAAHAADYDPPIFVEEAAEYVPVEVGSGWYLRGDVGYVFDASIGEVEYTLFDPIAAANVSPPSPRLRSIPISPGAAASATASPTIFAPTRRSTASAPTSTARRQALKPAQAIPVDDTTCRSENSSEVSAVSVMANGYVDLGTYVGFTPYVGAGPGYSYVSWSDLNDTTYCVPGGAALRRPSAQSAAPATPARTAGASPMR